MNSTPSSYDPQRLENFFDEYGEQEWQRLTANPVAEINLYIHRAVLEKHIRPGWRVLEIGAGAGRFTQILAGLGALITAADLSKGQLDLNRKYAAELGFSSALEEWAQVDICDLSRYSSASFDAIVAYGGPFSYVLDRRDQALSECLRVLRPDGLLLISVMSLWGTCHRVLKGVLATPAAENQRITTSGDLTAETLPERRNQFMHLFRSAELHGWLLSCGVEVLEMAASGCLGSTWDELLEEIRTDEEKWNELLRMELEASSSPGALDMGTHLIAVVRKPV
jgi:2-polyprenyl-3-methyl-5-hydroxy-6-metoxy-1,4-benzoquinol methylase